MKQRAQAWQSAAVTRARFSSASASRASASAWPKSWPGVTTHPVRPSTTESLIPGAAIATQGTPHAAASITEQPHPSATEVAVVAHARLSRLSRTASGW